MCERHRVRSSSSFIATIFAVVVLTGCGAAQRTDTLPGQEAVQIDGLLSNSYVPSEQPSSIKARLRISARYPDLGRRAPINLALVVDTSGSMEGEPIENARLASLALVEMLSPGDRLAVVTFDSTTNVLVESTELRRRSIARIREQIGTMEARGTTDLAGGLSAGLTQVYNNFDQSGINRVVLLSDGVPNDASQIEQLATAAGQRSVAITALGLGLEYDETLLGSIAQNSGGRFHYLEESAEVATVFRDEVLRLERIVGRNAVVTVMPGPGVSIETVIGQQGGGNGRGVRISVGDLVDGESRDYFVQLAVNGRRAGATVELFDAVLAYNDTVDQSGVQEQRLFLGARSTDSEEEIAAGRNEEVETGAAEVQAATVTVQAIALARSGETDQALQLLRDGVRQLTDVDSAELNAQVESMESLAGAIPTLAVEPVAEETVEYDFEDEPTSGSASPRRERRRARANRRPAAAPAASERIIRTVHEDAMDTILGQKC